MTRLTLNLLLSASLLACGGEEFSSASAGAAQGGAGLGGSGAAQGGAGQGGEGQGGNAQGGVAGSAAGAGGSKAGASGSTPQGGKAGEGQAGEGGAGGEAAGEAGAAGDAGATSSGGAAGAAGEGGSSGKGGQGSGGQGAKCKTSSDCPKPTDECTLAINCEAGACVAVYAKANSPTSVQTAGDCKLGVCDGKGGYQKIPDNSDATSDNNPCTADTCSADGTTSHTPVEAGNDCGNGHSCDSQGNCVGCQDGKDCPGADDECKTRTCNAGVCGFNYVVSDSPVGNQTAGDCKKTVCDGSGNSITVADDGDPPATDSPCTIAQCANGAIQQVPRPEGTSCGAGKVCSAAGVCVGCNKDSDCTLSTDVECQVPACLEGTCGFKPQADGVACGDSAVQACTGGVCGCADGTLLVPKTPGADQKVCKTFGGAFLQTSPGSCDGGAQNPYDEKGMGCGCPEGAKPFSLTVTSNKSQQELVLCLPPKTSAIMGGAYLKNGKDECLKDAYGAGCTCSDGIGTNPIPFAAPGGPVYLYTCFGPKALPTFQTNATGALKMPAGCDLLCASSQGGACKLCQGESQKFNLDMPACFAGTNSGTLTICYP